MPQTRDDLDSYSRICDAENDGAHEVGERSDEHHPGQDGLMESEF
jgi:hypothetical protein